MSINRRKFIKASGLIATTSIFAPFAAPVSKAGAPAPSNAEGTISTKKNPVVILRSSWGDTNIGDQGHTPGTIRLLYQYVPNVEILLWHVDPRPVTEALVLRHFPRVKIIRGKFFDNGKPMDAELKNSFEKADMFIFNSGMAMNFGLFTTDWAANMSSLSSFIWCKENAIPFGIYGQSFDQFLHPSMEIYRNVLNQAAFVYCRDGESLKFLKENKFHPNILEFGPDGCFGINVKNDEKGLAYLKEKGLENQKFLAVVSLTNTPPIGKKEDPLNPANPNTVQQEQDKTRMSKIRDMITQWVHKTGMKVLLSPEVNKEMEPAKRLIFDLLPADVQSKVIWRDVFWDADEAMSIYAQAHTVFGMEPHSLIMALTNGVPIIHAWPPSHGRKCWMFRDIGLPEWLFEVDDSTADQWTTVLMDNVNNYPAARNKVNKAMQFVKQRQASTMKIINNSIQSKITV